MCKAISSAGEDPHPASICFEDEWCNIVRGVMLLDKKNTLRYFLPGISKAYSRQEYKRYIIQYLLGKYVQWKMVALVEGRETERGETNYTDKEGLFCSLILFTMPCAVQLSGC